MTCSPTNQLSNKQSVGDEDEDERRMNTKRQPTNDITMTMKNKSDYNGEKN